MRVNGINVRVPQVATSTQRLLAYNKGLARNVNMINCVNWGGRGIRVFLGNGVFNNYGYRAKDYGSLSYEIVNGICGRGHSMGYSTFLGTFGGRIKLLGNSTRYNGCGNGQLDYTTCLYLPYGLYHGVYIEGSTTKRCKGLLPSCRNIGPIGYKGAHLSGFLQVVSYNEIGKGPIGVRSLIERGFTTTIGKSTGPIGGAKRRVL